MHDLFDFLFEDDNENELNKDYIKIVYQTNPIGKEGIILYLTTFDIEAYNKDKEIKDKQVREDINIRELQRHNGLIPDGMVGPQTLRVLEEYLNNKVDIFYKEEMLKIKNFFAELDKQKRKRTHFGDVTNCQSIICDVVEGDIVNCNSVHCKEIKGDTINCKIYQN